MTTVPSDVVRALYATLNRGDVPAFLGLLDEEVA